MIHPLFYFTTTIRRVQLFFLVPPLCPVSPVSRETVS